MNISDYCVSPDLSLQQALWQLDHVPCKTLYVTDETMTLLGALTDGDVRRYLISGGSIQSELKHAANPHPRTAKSRGEAEKMLAASTLKSVPLTDKEGKILSIVFRNQQKEQRLHGIDLPVVIMAGGKGTRLEPYTKILPKPLIPVGEKPILEHIMQEFQNYGCNRFHLIVNHKKQLIKAYFAESSGGFTPSYYDEDTPLGTGGGLYLLKGKIRETFFLTNCDILVKADYETLLRFHRESRNTITMVCAHKTVTIPYGVVETDSQKEITAMKEKPSFSFMTNTGFYVVEPEVLEDIEDNTPIGFPDIIEQQRQKGRKTAVFSVEDSEWMDMGQLTTLEEMRERLYGR